MMIISFFIFISNLVLLKYPVVAPKGGGLRGLHSACSMDIIIGMIMSMLAETPLP